MASDARRANPWTRVFTDNLGLKAMALSLSLLLSYLVHSDVDAQRAIHVDVVALLPPPNSGKSLMTELPAQVKVTLRGSGSKLSSLSRDDLSPIQLDLRQAKDGPFYLDASLVDAGSNVQVVEISPSTLQLTWAATGEKRVPIELVLDGELPKGRELGPVELEPSYITVRGPRALLEDIESVLTEPLSVERVDIGAHTRRVPLKRLPDHLSYVEDTAVAVGLSVTPAVAQEVFKHLEVAVLGEGRFALRPDHVNVTLRGSQQLLSDLEAEALVPYVELDPAHIAGTRAYDVRLRGVPEAISAITISPPSVLAWPKGKP